MSKQSILEHTALFRDKLSIAQIIGMSGVVFYLHILGIREGLEPVGFVLNSPINAGYIFTDIMFAFASAYLVEILARVAVFTFEEVRNVVAAKLKGKIPKIIISSESDFDYAYSTWISRITLTLIFYAWFFWFLGLILVVLIFVGSFLFRRFKKSKPKQARYDDLSDEEHQMLGTYLKRSLLGIYLALACLLSYGVGLARIEHLKSLQPFIIATSQSVEHEGQLIYSFSNSYILYENENDRYVVLPHDDTVIQEPTRLTATDSAL